MLRLYLHCSPLFCYIWIEGDKTCRTCSMVNEKYMKSLSESLKCWIHLSLLYVRGKKCSLMRWHVRIWIGFIRLGTVPIGVLVMQDEGKVPVPLSEVTCYSGRRRWQCGSVRSGIRALHECHLTFYVWDFPTSSTVQHTSAQCPGTFLLCMGLPHF